FASSRWGSVDPCATTCATTCSAGATLTAATHCAARAAATALSGRRTAAWPARAAFLKLRPLRGAAAATADRALLRPRSAASLLRLDAGLVRAGAAFGLRLCTRLRGLRLHPRLRRLGRALRLEPAAPFCRRTLLLALQTLAAGLQALTPLLRG